MIVADTDVLIDALRGHEPVASRVRELLEADGLATTVLSVFELLSGAKSERERELVERILAPLPVYPADDGAARAAAAVRRELEVAGAKIGMADTRIAGVCLSRGASLFTRNRKHFERVSGLRLAQ